MFICISEIQISNKTIKILICSKFICSWMLLKKEHLNWSFWIQFLESTVSYNALNKKITKLILKAYCLWRNLNKTYSAVLHLSNLSLILPYLFVKRNLVFANSSTSFAILWRNFGQLRACYVQLKNESYVNILSPSNSDLGCLIVCTYRAWFGNNGKLCCMICGN